MNSAAALPYLIVLVLCMIFRRFYCQNFFDEKRTVNSNSIFTMGKEMLVTSRRRRLRQLGRDQRDQNKSEDLILYEEIFGDHLDTEPWSPTEEDFDELIKEYDFEDAFGLERVKNEELRMEVCELKKQIRTLTKDKIQLELDLQRSHHKHTKEMAAREEIINGYESQNLLLKAELDQLIKSQSCKKPPLKSVKIPSPTSSSLSSSQKGQKQTDSNNNNNCPPNHPLIQRKPSAILSLIKGFEAKAAAAEAAAVTVKVIRRNTIASSGSG